MPYETQFNTTFYLFVDPKNEEADKELCQLHDLSLLLGTADP